MSAIALRKELAKLREKLGDATAPILDIIDPVSWSEMVSGFTLDEWQRTVLLSAAKRQILLCSRQSGKSTVTACLAALIASRGGRVIVVAPSLRQSSNLFRMMRSLLQKAGARLLRETATEIALAGGGWATCLPGDRPSMLRGLSLRSDGESALIIDEAAFVKDELFPVATPMLAAADNARLILLSTPAGPSGEFYRIWEQEDGFEKITVKAHDCPRISAEFLEEERRRLGILYRQEYEGEFLSSGSSVFSASAIAAMFSRDVTGPVGDDEIDWNTLLAAPSVEDDVSKAKPKSRMWSF